jgi:hypothetical protein
MSFWSNLAKIGGFAAAPFTGGASIPLGMAAGGALDAFGKASGAAGQGMASNRGTKAELMLDEQSDFERQLLARELEKRAARSAAYRDAVVGAHGMNFQPAVRPGSVTTPSYYQPSAERQLAAEELFRQGNRRLLQPDLVNASAPPALQRLMDNPEFLRTLSPSIWEKLLGIAGVAAPAAGMFMGGGDQGGK